MNMTVHINVSAKTTKAIASKIHDAIKYGYVSAERPALVDAETWAKMEESYCPTKRTL